MNSEARDIFFSADVETDGPIPGPYSMLSFALVRSGSYDGKTFVPPADFDDAFTAYLRPISTEFQAEALRVNGLDRETLIREGGDPFEVMNAAATWINERSVSGTPILVAFPLSFDWTWLYWYFTRFVSEGSPFKYSRCFDLKTAYSIKSGRPISLSGREAMPPELRSARPHTHRALDDAIEQAEIFAKLMHWRPTR